jgi:hypothetical protein
MRDHHVVIVKTIGLLIAFIIFCPLSQLAAEGNKLEDHIIETETGVYYVVQPGDTLWDLSQRFSDSAWLWPDLWKENKDIPNPHLIYPGQRVQIYRRTDIGDIAKKAMDISDLQPGPDGTFAYKGIDMVGFIRNPALLPSGIIFHSDDAKAMLNTDDIVYIKPEIPSDFKVGDKFTVYRTLVPLRDKSTSKIIGTQHLIMGVVTITDIQSQVITGEITKTFRSIEIDDKVTPIIDRPENFSIKESVQGLEGKIFFSEHHLELISEHNTAFIDKGQKDGVEIGQFYSIFLQPTELMNRKNPKPVLIPKRSIGELLVLHTEETTSTVLITKSEKPAPPGTSFSSPF